MKKIRYDHRANIETRVHQCFQCLMLLRGGAQPLRHVERRATRSLRSKFHSGAVLTLEQAEEERGFGQSCSANETALARLFFTTV
jgi:hypothetical protein